MEKILQAIRERSKTSVREMQIVTDPTRRGVEWNLRKLKSEGIIKRVPRKAVIGKLLISKISLRGVEKVVEKGVENGGEIGDDKG